MATHVVTNDAAALRRQTRNAARRADSSRAGRVLDAGRAKQKPDERATGKRAEMMNRFTPGAGWRQRLPGAIARVRASRRCRGAAAGAVGTAVGVGSGSRRTARRVRNNRAPSSGRRRCGVLAGAIAPTARWLRDRGSAVRVPRPRRTGGRLMLRRRSVRRAASRSSTATRSCNSPIRQNPHQRSAPQPGRLSSQPRRLDMQYRSAGTPA